MSGWDTDYYNMNKYQRERARSALAHDLSRQSDDTDTEDDSDDDYDQYGDRDRASVPRLDLEAIGRNRGRRRDSSHRLTRPQGRFKGSRHLPGRGWHDLQDQRPTRKPSLFSKFFLWFDKKMKEKGMFFTIICKLVSEDFCGWNGLDDYQKERLKEDLGLLLEAREKINRIKKKREEWSPRTGYDRTPREKLESAIEMRRAIKIEKEAMKKAEADSPRWRKQSDIQAYIIRLLRDDDAQKKLLHTDDQLTKKEQDNLVYEMYEAEEEVSFGGGGKRKRKRKSKRKKRRKTGRKTRKNKKRKTRKNKKRKTRRNKKRKGKKK